ncbi:MAG: PTS system mannose/fructose/sorbose family transporter subunit IID [Bacilli bacterium]
MSNKITIKDEKKMLNELFWSSFILENCYNYERQQALGYAIGMWPAIKRFYHTKEDRAKALTRHMSIFNTTPHVVSVITGVSVALEKEASENIDFDVTTINSVKVGLMGPLAGIGDSLFWGTIRVIASGIGISLAQQGSIMGAILFLVIFNVPHLLVRYFGLHFGYRSGMSLIGNAKDSGILQKVSKAATIVGLMVVGAMSAKMVKLATVYEIKVGEATFPIQTYLDQIFPLLLPLLYTLLMFYLLKKGWKASMILLLTIAVGIIGVIIKLL